MQTATRVRLPAHGWRPRDYQRPLWDYLERGGKRAVACWHRRAGKDEVFLHRTAIAAQERVGTYWYMLPQANQARKAIWEAVNPKTGRKRVDDAFPQELRDTTKDQEMFIQFRSGSTWQVVGSDNFDSLVGSPPIGIVFSEWSLSNPLSWTYLRPILLENGGWAVFNFTPRGRNHASKTLETARSEPSWFHQVLTVDDTNALSREGLDAELRELVKDFGPQFGEAFFRQEYYCSFDAPILGSYYAHILESIEHIGHMKIFPYEPGHPVYTGWDLGVGDSTSIWFAQVIHGVIRIIDYYENMGQGADHYVAQLRAGHRSDWVYGRHFTPHDTRHREWGSGKTRLDTLKGFGVTPTIIPITHSIDDDINVVRQVLRKCWFNIGSDAVKDGLEKLRQYRATYDEKKKVLSNTPLHDFTSHAADGFRALAIGFSRHMLHGQPMMDPVMSEGIRMQGGLQKFAGQRQASAGGKKPFGFRK